MGISQTLPAATTPAIAAPRSARAASTQPWPFLLIFLSSSPLFFIHLLPGYNAVIAGSLTWLAIRFLLGQRLELQSWHPGIFYCLLYAWIIAYNLAASATTTTIAVYFVQLILLFLAWQSISADERLAERLKAVLVVTFAIFGLGQVLAVLFVLLGVVYPSAIVLHSYFDQVTPWVPFLSFLSGESIRVFGVPIARTCSFFLEPSAYVNTLVLPLLWSFQALLKSRRDLLSWSKFLLIFVGGMIAGSVSFYIFVLLFAGAYALNRAAGRVRAWTIGLAVLAAGLVGYSYAGLLSYADSSGIHTATRFIGDNFSDIQLLDKESSFNVRAHWIQRDLDTIRENPWGVGFGDEDNGGTANAMSNALTTYLFSGPIGCILLAILYLTAFRLVSRQRSLSVPDQIYMLGGLSFLLLNLFVLSYSFFTCGNVICLSIFFGDAYALTLKAPRGQKMSA